MQRLTHPFDELFSIIVDNAFREPNLAETNVLVHLLSVFGIERTPTTTHLEQENTQTPEIDKFRVAVFIEEYLRRKVFSRTAKRVCQFIRSQVRFRQAEITQRNMSGSIKKDILRFEIPKNAIRLFLVIFLHNKTTHAWG